MEKLTIALEWANRISGARSVNCLRDILVEASTWLGARYFALTQHVNFTEKPKALRLHNYPFGWESYYDEHRFALSDPIHRASHRKGRSFLWADVPKIIRLDRADIQMLHMGRQIGLGEGLTVPFHIPGEARGSCSFVAEIGTNLAFGALLLAESFGAAAFDRLLDLQPQDRIRRLPRLTLRQRQCAALSARGIGNREIARILRISVHTVAEHLSQAYARLGVTSRIELTVLMLHLGDLSYDDVTPRFELL